MPRPRTMSLPSLLFVLSCRPEKRRLPDRHKAGYVVRAAALTELTLRGSLYDEAGKVAVRAGGPTGDGVLDSVLDQIAGDPGRSWKHWVRKEAKTTLAAVQDQLRSSGAITVRPHRILGVFRADEIDLPDPALVPGIEGRLETALRLGRTADPYDAALAALVVAGGLGHVLSWSERRSHKAKLEELNARVGAAGPALKAAIGGLTAARSSGGWSGHG